MFHLGLDFGSTLTKMVLTEPDAEGEIPQLQASFQYKTHPDPSGFYEALEQFLRDEQIPLAHIHHITATGTHANLVKDNILRIPTRIVPEVPSIGLGGLALSGLDNALVVNMGTGTTYVLADKHECRHLGGTGMGGGTLSGLGVALLQTKSVTEISNLATKGNLDHVDLLMKDVTDQVYPNLPSTLTAANFGKLAHQLHTREAALATPEDIACGLINMVLQIIGSMAVMVCKSCSTKNVVFVGSLTRLPQLAPIAELFSNVYGLHFMVPPFAVFATALGSTFTSEEYV